MFELFAQAAGNDPNPFKGLEGTALMIVGLVSCVLLLLVFILAIFFLVSMSKALDRCRPRNRSMEPGMVWLMLIPLFNIIWSYFLVNRVTESIKREFRSRGWPQSGDFGQGIGMTACVIWSVNFFAQCIPYLGPVLFLVQVICWIVFWVKIAGFSSELARDPGDGDYDDDRGADDHWHREEEDEDDRDRR
jgi:hypothetical protein